MRVSKEAQATSAKMSKCKGEIMELIEKGGFTSVETMLILSGVMETHLHYELRYERHGNYDTPAMAPQEDE